MEFVKLFLIVLGAVAFAVTGLAVRILLKKKGQFPETHVGHNSSMKTKGITCVKTMDKMEQRSQNSYLRYKYRGKYSGLRLIKE